MLLLADLVSFCEPARDFGVEIGFFGDTKGMGMTARVECLDLVEARTFDASRQNKMTNQMRLTRHDTGEAHPRLKDDASFCGIMCTGPQARTVAANTRKSFATRGSLRANRSSGENLPQECHMFLPVKRSPHFGHVQSGF
jgi:hypothetical protein